uniref:Uncharacterized protein n=1 Tax=Arundo donax TaxID=35708 RepID=A0A0A9AQL6_ARUDO
MQLYIKRYFVHLALSYCYIHFYPKQVLTMVVCIHYYLSLCSQKFLFIPFQNCFPIK